MWLKVSLAYLEMSRRAVLTILLLPAFGFCLRFNLVKYLLYLEQRRALVLSAMNHRSGAIWRFSSCFVCHLVLTWSVLNYEEIAMLWTLRASFIWPLTLVLFIFWVMTREKVFQMFWRKVIRSAVLWNTTWLLLFCYTLKRRWLVQRACLSPRQFQLLTCSFLKSASM